MLPSDFSKAVVLKLRYAKNYQVLMKTAPFYAGQLQRPFPQERGAGQVLQELYLRTTAPGSTVQGGSINSEQGTYGTEGLGVRILWGTCEQGEDEYRPTTWAYYLHPLAWWVAPVR